jgi:hypothetical protein
MKKLKASGRSDDSTRMSRTEQDGLTGGAHPGTLPAAIGLSVASHAALGWRTIQKQTPAHLCMAEKQANSKRDCEQRSLVSDRTPSNALRALEGENAGLKTIRRHSERSRSIGKANLGHVR